MVRANTSISSGRAKPDQEVIRGGSHLPSPASTVGPAGAWVLLPWLTAPIAVRLLRGVLGGTAGAELNPLLAATAQLCFLYSVLLAVGYAV